MCLLLVGVLPVGADTTSFTDREIAAFLAQGPWPQTPLADPGNEYSGNPLAETLGKALFNSTLLSGDETLSCASCHVEHLGFAEPKPVAIGVATHVRNTQGLLDVGLQRWFGWDGGADSLWSATLRPMLSEVEMAADIDVVARRLQTVPQFMSAVAELSGLQKAVINERRAADNDPPTENERLVVIAAKFIGAYVRTLASPRTPFDDYRDAVFNDDTEAQKHYPAAAKRGLKLFLGEANCQLCHFGPRFSNGEFHDTGRPFFTGVGEVDPGRYAGIQRLRADRYNLLGPYNGTHAEHETRKTRTVKLGQANFGQWRTPSLRNLTRTAPYMHDGSIATLRGVVDAYADIDPDRLHNDGEALLQPLDLTDNQRNDLVEFLRTLSP